MSISSVPWTRPPVCDSLDFDSPGLAPLAADFVGSVKADLLLLIIKRRHTFL
jgi:hypothetical protein